MDSISNSGLPSKPSSKRLFFDRRYGWVFDEWKDPSQEALSGGRGMFCILPLSMALLKAASQSINQAANSAVKVLERPNLLSPQELRASFDDQLHKFVSSIQKPEFSLFALKGNSTISASGNSSHPQDVYNKEIGSFGDGDDGLINWGRLKGLNLLGADS